MFALLALLILTSAFIAAILPLLVMASRALKGSRAFAALYAANTGGSVCGSLAAGFVLLPWLGTRMTGFLFELLLIGLATALLFRDRRTRNIAVAAFATCILLHFSHNVPRQLYEQRIGPDTKIVEFREGIESNVMVTDDKSGMRKLWIGSIWVAGTGGPHVAFGHVPGLFVERPKKVLGIALGTGQTFAAVFKHKVEHLDCVEIDAGVVELSRKWFREANRGLLDDPRVQVHIEDGRAFMRSTHEKYDLIVLEPLQSWTAGTSNLYTREFYEDARRILVPGGVVAQWLPFYGQGPAETQAMAQTGLEVFNHGTLWLVGKDGLLIYTDEPLTISLARWEKRIANRGIRGDLRRFPADSAADLLSFMLLGPDGLRAWADGAEIISDDRPFLEFRAARSIGKGKKLLPILDSIRPHLDDFADYATAAPATEKEQISLADQIRRTVFELNFIPQRQHKKRMTLLESVRPHAASSTTWRRLYQIETQSWLKSAGEQTPAGRAILLRGQRRLEQSK
jgi:spermidine synthase